MRLSSLHSKVTKQAGERSLTVSINFPETLVVGGGGEATVANAATTNPKLIHQLNVRMYRQLNIIHVYLNILSDG